MPATIEGRANRRHVEYRPKTNQRPESHTTRIRHTGRRGQSQGAPVGRIDRSRPVNRRSFQSVRADPRPTDKRRPHRSPTNANAIQQDSPWAFTSFIDQRGLEKSLVVFSSCVAITLVLLFGSDLLSGWPLKRASLLFDTTSVACGAGLAYLCWDTRKDLRSSR